MKFCKKKILSRNFDFSESWLTKGMGQNNISIQKKYFYNETWTTALFFAMPAL
jgi:hypothetical protein